MSEFADTITENIQVLQDKHLTYIERSKFIAMAREIKPLRTAQGRLNNNKSKKEKEDKSPPMKEDVKMVKR